MAVVPNSSLLAGLFNNPNPPAPEEEDDDLLKKIMDMISGVSNAASNVSIGQKEPLPNVPGEEGYMPFGVPGQRLEPPSTENSGLPAFRLPRQEQPILTGLAEKFGGIPDLPVAGGIGDFLKGVLEFPGTMNPTPAESEEQQRVLDQYERQGITPPATKGTDLPRGIKDLLGTLMEPHPQESIDRDGLAIALNAFPMTGELDDIARVATRIPAALPLAKPMARESATDALRKGQKALEGVKTKVEDLGAAPLIAEETGAVNFGDSMKKTAQEVFDKLYNSETPLTPGKLDVAFQDLRKLGVDVNDTADAVRMAFRADPDNEALGYNALQALVEQTRPGDIANPLEGQLRFRGSDVPAAPTQAPRATEVPVEPPPLTAAGKNVKTPEPWIQEALTRDKAELLKIKDTLVAGARGEPGISETTNTDELIKRLQSRGVLSVGKNASSNKMIKDAQRAMIEEIRSSAIKPTEPIVPPEPQPLPVPPSPTSTTGLTKEGQDLLSQLAANPNRPLPRTAGFKQILADNGITDLTGKKTADVVEMLRAKVPGVTPPVETPPAPTPALTKALQRAGAKTPEVTTPTVPPEVVKRTKEAKSQLAPIEAKLNGRTTTQAKSFVDGQEAFMEDGTKVLVTNTADPSLVTVRLSNGLEVRVGRQRLMDGPPGQEPPMPPSDGPPPGGDGTPPIEPPAPPSKEPPSSGKGRGKSSGKPPKGTPPPRVPPEPPLAADEPIPPSGIPHPSWEDVEAIIDDKLVPLARASKRMLPERAETVREVRTERLRSVPPRGDSDAIEHMDTLYDSMAGDIVKGETFDYAPKYTFTDAELRTMANYIEDTGYPVLTRNAAIKALDALTGIRKYPGENKGEVLQKGQVALLEKMFGNKVSREYFTDAVNWGDINISTAILSSGDWSGLLNQGGVPLAGDPRSWVEALKPMLKATGSERGARQVWEQVIHDPLYPLMDAMGTDFVNPFGKMDAGGRQEEFSGLGMSKLSQAVEKYYPGLRPSERSYITTGNELRRLIVRKTLIDWFGEDNATAVAQAIRNGETLEDAVEPYRSKLGDIGNTATAENLRRLGGALNAFTGRGVLPKALEKFLPFMNATFFAPRFFASRIEVPLHYGLMALNPQHPAELRKVLARHMVGFVAENMAMLATVKALTGDEVDIETDPHSSDFGRIQYGPHRIDFWAGFQPLARFIAQMKDGEVKSLGSGVMTDKKRYEGLDSLLMQFVRTKFRPSAGMAYDVVLNGNRDPKGEAVIPGSMDDGRGTDFALGFAGENFTPLSIQDLYDSFQQAKKYGTNPVFAPIIAGLGGRANSFDIPQDRLPELRAYSSRAELVATYLAKESDNPSQFAKDLVEWSKVTAFPDTSEWATNKRRDILSRVDEPTLKNFNSIVNQFGNKILNSYPEALKELKAEGKLTDFTPTVDELPTEEYVLHPVHKDGSTAINDASARTDLARIFGPKWGAPKPPGRPVPFNWLSPAQQKSINDWLDKANLATVRAYGKQGKDKWTELSKAARDVIEKTIGPPEEPEKDPRKIVNDIFADIQERIAEEQEKLAGTKR